MTKPKKKNPAGYKTSASQAASKRRGSGKQANLKSKPKKDYTPAQVERIINRVIKRQESVIRKDFADWKKAKQQATSVTDPRQLLLQVLYEDIMEDPLMTSQISVLRIGKSQGADFVLKLNGEIDDEATELLKDSGLYEDCVELIVESVFFNNSVMEFSYTPEGLEVDIIPRKHISPEVGKFFPDAAGTDFIPYREVPEFRKWLVEVYPRKRDLGLLNKAVPYVLIKKFALSCWSELCEIFGIPPRVMKTNTADDQMLDRAERMMKEIGAAAHFIIDTTEQIEWAQAVNTNGDIFKNIISTCKEELSLLNIAAVLGQDTENGNRSKEESSSELMEAVIKADKRLIEANFNKKILPALASIGFLKPGLRLEIVKALDTEKLWKMVCEAADRWELDWEWVKDTFQIEIVGKKSFSVVPPAGDDGTDPDGDGSGGDQDPEKDPDGAGDKKPEEEPGKKSTPGKKKTEKEEETRSVFLDAPLVGALTGADLTEFNQALISRVAAGQSGYWDAELFWYFASDLLSAIKTTFKTALKSPARGISYNAPDDVYTAALEQNIFHFSAAKTLAELQELNQAFRESKSYAEFRDKAANITTTFNDKWQRTEYRNAVQVGEAASAYRRQKAQTHIFPIWRYRTVDDDQVRASHKALDGLELPADHPKWNEIYPPNDWGCRCWVDPIMEYEHEGDFDDDLRKVEQYQASAEWKKAKAQGWGVNRAITGEIFTADQMYIRKFPDNARKYLGKLDYKSFNLETFATRTKKATEILGKYAGRPGDWLATNGQIKDFAGKVVTMDGKTFKTATTGENGAQKVSLLPSVTQTLATPDEVWFNGRGQTFDRVSYVKFYQGTAVAVECSIVEGKTFEILSWQEIVKPSGKVQRSADPRWYFRSGLLVKK